VGVAVEQRDGAGAPDTGTGPAGSSGDRAHLPGLDGLRGIAVAAVVAYHLGYGWAQGGYLGVDTFLVLSGFLITSGLVAEHARTGRVAIVTFWGRRVRRLLPALWIVVAAVVVWAAVAVLPDEARTLRLDALSALGFVSNWRFVLTGQGYFGQAAAPSLLRHTWSLGVEAQLYLVWPPIVVFLLMRRGRHAVAAGAIVLAAGSWALGALLAHPGNVTRSYYGTDTRAAGFLVGAAVAAVLVGNVAAPIRRRRPVVALLGAVGAAATAVLWTRLPGSSNWLFHGGLALAGLSAAALVIDVVRRPWGFVARVCSLAPLRLLGRVSYGVYLWHWPLFLVLDHRRTGLSGAELLGVRLGAVAVATTISWVVVERPVLLRKAPRAVPRSWHPALAAAITVGLAAAVAVPVVDHATTTVTVAAPFGRAPALAAPTTAPLVTTPGVPPPPTTPPSTAPPVPISAAVLGDSVSVTLSNALAAVSRFWSVQVTNGGIVGCGVALGTEVRSDGQASPIPGSCYRWQSTWQATLARARPDVVVILLGRWELLDRVLDGRWQHIGQPAFDAYLGQQLDSAITTAGSSGAAVVLCNAPYFLGMEAPQGGTFPENDAARVDRWNELVREAETRHPGVVSFDLNALMSPNGHYVSEIDGVAVRSSDGVHFSVAAGSVLGPALLPVIRDAALTAGTLTGKPGKGAN
jgi:peptidoglycan/LPS O-acetylase OafA/YrhL